MAAAAAAPLLQATSISRRFGAIQALADVEIARLLARDARILILDEPTAALADVEIERVKHVVRSLATKGRAVVYVTHRLGEVFEIADRVTVLRNGVGQPPVPVAELSMGDLVARILGRP